MRIVAISDTHGRHWDMPPIPEGDVLIHGGDITLAGKLEDVVDFNDFLGTLPHAHKIVIAGNHDFCLERRPEEARPLLTHAIYLEDEAITLKGIKFYGSPWQPWFWDWAFQLRRGPEIRAKWDLIPDDTDVLITHGPPQGILDKTTRNEHAGCQDLREVVLGRVRPKLHIFGHIHEAAGVVTQAQVCFTNASTCNFSLDPVNPPLVFDLEI